MENQNNYIYQYDLDGFPLPKARDVANRMKFHRIKLRKLCPVCEKNLCINKPNHRCVDCQLNSYVNNSQLDSFMPKEEQICM